MKQFSIFRKAALIVSVAVVLASCQKEEEPVIIEDDNSEISLKSTIEGCADQVLVIKTFKTRKLQEAIESFGCNFNSLVIDSKTTLSLKDLYYVASLKLVLIDFSRSVFENNTIPEGPFIDLKTDIIFPTSTTTIWGTALSGSSIKTIYLPNVTMVGDFAFDGCKNLSVVNLPRLTKVERGVFRDCTGLISVNLFSAKTIESFAFEGAVIKVSLKLDNADEIEAYGLSECSVKSVSLPKATTIAYRAFTSCTATSLYLPKVTVVEDYAFEDCKFSSIYLPEVAIIGDMVFSRNKNLTSVRIPKAIEIGDLVFGDCYNLESLEVGPNLAIVGEYLFGTIFNPYDPTCPENLTVTMTGAPPVISGEISCLQSVRVPQHLMNEYEASQWSAYNLTGY